MRSFKQIAKAKFRKARDVRETSATKSKGDSETRGKNAVEVAWHSSEWLEKEYTVEPRGFVQPDSPPPDLPQLVCLEPEFPKNLWDCSRTQTDRLAKSIIDYQYHTKRLSPMSSQGRRAFLNQVETLLQEGADPNLTLCVYRVGERVLHRLLGNDSSLASLMSGFVDDDTISVPSGEARLVTLFSPFLESVALDDIEMIKLFFRYGVNARDLTREFEIYNRDFLTAHLIPLSASRRFQSIRDVVKNVELSQDTSLQTRVVNDILRTLWSITRGLYISYDGIDFISDTLKEKINELMDRRSVTVSGDVWYYARSLPTDGCKHVRSRILGVYQDEPAASRASSSAMCSMCQLVDGHRGDVTNSELSLTLRHIRETQGYELISSVTGTHDRRHTVNFVPSEVATVMDSVSSFIDRSTGSLAAVTLSKHWLANCARTHTACQQKMSTYIPTRLVEILDDGMVQIVEHSLSAYIYAALSHRWSRDESSKTTSLNFTERLFPFKADRLSPALRDSLIAVQNLGCRFLWVDMLCIIQDSEQDWLHEAAEMRHVYSNAVVTIAAECTGDKSDDEGILRPRDLGGLRPFPLRRLEDYTNEEVEPLFRSAKDSKNKSLYIFPDGGDKQHGIRPKGVLDTRGWILQEQLLSPRILYYGHQQLYWDCIDQSASEVSPLGVSLLDDTNSGETWAFRLIRRTIAGDGDPRMLAKLIADVWIYVVENYSARALTKQSDKLIALQGVITALKSVLQLSSVAGMWEQGLWKQLTWWVARPAITTAPRTPPFPAPTWSWLSIDGVVSHHRSMRMHKDPVQLDDLAPLPGLRCTITNVHAEPTSVSVLLDLSATSFSYMLTANDLREMTWKRGHPAKLNLAPASWMLDRELELPLELQCVIIAEDEAAKMTVGMCLVAHDSQPDTWKRAGVFLWEGLTWQIARYAGKELQIGHFAVI